MPALNSPPVAAEEDAPLSKPAFGELAPLLWLADRADVSNENSAACAGGRREAVRRVVAFGA